jgi:hypothetical protein
VTLTAVVSSSSGAVNQGTLTFTVMQGANTIGNPVTVNVSSIGVASAPYTLPAATAVGTYTIQAAYNGTAVFYASSDNSQSLTVSAAATTTTAANSSLTFSTASQSAPLGATVSSPGGTVSEGTETFTILDSKNNTVGGPMTVNVSGGSASVNYTLPSGQAGGTYTVSAVYNGTVHFASSTDTSHTLTINPASTTTNAPNASTTFSTIDQNISLSATVNSSAGTISEGTATLPAPPTT